MEGEIRNREDSMKQLHATTVSIYDQIKEVKRELALRRVVYQKKLDAGTMSRDESHTRITTMEAVLLTLEKSAQHELPLPLHNPPR